MKKIILGSNSPRRRELLEEIGFDFEVKRMDVEERISPEWDIMQVAEKLSMLKNDAYRQKYQDEIIITADTVVINNSTILGKPKSKDEAYNMLDSLHGSTHQVVSAACISSTNLRISFTDTVDVKMSSLSEEEIRFYVERYKPFDKAGAYGIQEWIGMIAVEWIKGSYYTVMGLPIHKVYQSLKNDFHINPLI